jgi:para-nitrobenzyl esterase
VTVSTTVTISPGRVAGVDEERSGRRLRVWRGIPFAAPPTGPRRWRPPEPVAPWSGIRDATAFGPAAPQLPGFATALPAEAMACGPWDEAGCLTLNVWSPAGARGRPVLVWFHGGAFLTGSSAMATYDGATLAAEGDVVVVSANYRLGALGYAPVAGHANLGVLDQIHALLWVRDNISEFGGDPEQVTIFGESAGAGSVLHVLASPRSAGLVHRAIAQSGATRLTPTVDRMNEVADRLRHLVDVDGPVEAILDAQQKLLIELASGSGLMPFHPSLDGDVVPALPSAGLPGDVDLVIGTTADELSLFADDGVWTMDEDRCRRSALRYLENLTVSRPDLLLDTYTDLASPGARWNAVRTDGEMWIPCLDVAEANSGRTFVYRFDWPAAHPNERIGACHAIDIPFTFATFDRCGWDRFVGADDEALSLGQVLRRAWVAAASGQDPWPAYESSRRATMIFDRRCRVENDPRGVTRQAWRGAR